MILPPLTASPSAIEALRRKHLENPTYGAMGIRFASLVRRFARELKATSGLDYACGKGVLADLLVTEGTLARCHKYEIGVEAFAVPCPELVDLAICNHALYEFSPEAFVASVAYLWQISTLGAFISFQWGGPGQGAMHWDASMQDADWVFATLRAHWPCHRVLDSGPGVRLRQFVFMGFAQARYWI